MAVATIAERESQLRITVHAPVWRALSAWADTTAPRNWLAELITILQLVIGVALCFGIRRLIVGASTLFQKPQSTRGLGRYGGPVGGLRGNTIASPA